MMVTVEKGPDSQALQDWLQKRLGKELKKSPSEIDLTQPAEAFSLDSLVVVEICAELGNWIQGREIQVEQWWNAQSLRALCDSFAPVSELHSEVTLAAAPALEGPAAALHEVTALGAPLARVDAGRALQLLLKVNAPVSPGERYRFPGVAVRPDLLSVAYKLIDESTGEVRDTIYYGGSYMSNLRAWITRANESDTSHDVYVLNNGPQTVEIIVAAWTSTSAEGSGA
jgi:acyl carrier protein